MGDKTSIEWTRGDDGTSGATWNPVTGCDRVSSGCDNCYALTLAKRLKAMGVANYQTDGDPRTSGPGFGVATHPHMLDQPVRWTRPRRIFVNSMSDLFHPDVLKAPNPDGSPFPFLAHVFAVMAATPRHTYQVLTKRPNVMRAVLAEPRFRLDVNALLLQMGREVMPGGMTDPDFRWPAHMWFGVTVENDAFAWRADHLRASGAAVKFVSAEPLLSGLPSLDLAGIDWVIAGGESGHGARPMHPDWVRELRDRCVAAEVAFHFKQWGNWAPRGPADATHLLQVNGRYVTRNSATSVDPYGPGSGTQDLVDRGHPGWVRIRNVGKHAAGRELDGRTWDEYPAVSA